MIAGFNPADTYGVDHIRRVLETFPGVFTGIGEFTIHKEFVSAKVAGNGASLVDPAVDRILDFAAEVGLLVLIHSDIDMPFAPLNREPIYLKDTKELFRRHPKTTIIWAHTGLGRVVYPEETREGTAAAYHRSHIENLTEMLEDPKLKHVYFDISWDEVAKYALASKESETNVASLLNRFPNRFLFGTDVVAPPDQNADLRVFQLWQPVFAQLSPEASVAIRKTNYERLFDAARARVRSWEKEHVK